MSLYLYARTYTSHLRCCCSVTSGTILTDRQICIHKDRHTYIKKDTIRHAYMHIYIKTDRQADRQKDTHTHK